MLIIKKKSFNSLKNNFLRNEMGQKEEEEEEEDGNERRVNKEDKKMKLFPLRWVWRGFFFMLIYN